MGEDTLFPVWTQAMKAMPHQGVRRDVAQSNAHTPLSCERVSGQTWYPRDGLDWIGGREAYRAFAARPLTRTSRARVSPVAWELSLCWCECGPCTELILACPLGAVVSFTIMLLSSSIGPVSRMGNWFNSYSKCSEADPYVLMCQSMPPWAEVLHSPWPVFGVFARAAQQMRKDGMAEWHLGFAFSEQYLRARQRFEPRGKTFCSALGYRGTPSQCPLHTAKQLLDAALQLASSTDDAAVEQMAPPVDAVETLVSRAQNLIMSLLPRVPGISRCMQMQNLGLGLSLSSHRIFQRLARLQRVFERWLHVEPGRQVVDPSSPICPVAGAQWQGEWLVETDFLRDFHAELESALDSNHIVESPPPLATANAVPATEAQLADGDRRGLASGAPRAGRREAWVCTLFASSEVAWAQVALHAELIRTLAWSVRRVSTRPRPFVVLTEPTIPSSLQDEFRAEGILLEFFEPEPLLMRVPADREWQLSWWSGRALRPTMAQLAVWNLTTYDCVVMLDDDMLMVEASDELFNVPVFAMSHDPMPAGTVVLSDGSHMPRLNNAARVVQPNAALFHRMVEEIQSGKLDNSHLVNFWGYDLQSLEDAFWSQESQRLGITRFQPDGEFAGCMMDHQVKYSSAEPDARMTFLEASDRHRVHCLLPAEYNFFVDFKSVYGYVHCGLSTADIQSFGPRELVQRAISILMSQQSLTQRPKILHWPGDLRKPWQRPHVRARSAWDSLWWEAHSSMCSESAVPCRIHCDLPLRVPRNVSAAIL